ncbi:MAG: ketopantoate reductase family protein [Candidatus Hodarchaeota archaeon]
MKILVYGAGALGSVFGGYLARLHDVSLICRSPHAEAINKNGLVIHTPENSEFKIFPPASSSISNFNEIFDIIIISVKTYDLELACRTISEELGFSPILESSKSQQVTFCPKIILLQNGLGNEECASNFFPSTHIYRILTTNGAFFIKPGRVRHSGRGKTQIGKYIQTKGENIFLLQLCEILTEVGLKTNQITNLKERIWQKLAVNAAINPITALTGLRNGEILQSLELKEVLTKIVAEVEQVALISENLKLTNTLEKVLETLNDTKENRSSMLQDVKNRKKTEINFINGQIVKIGKKFNLQTPYNQLLTILIRTKEKSY